MYIKIEMTAKEFLSILGDALQNDDLLPVDHEMTAIQASIYRESGSATITISPIPELAEDA